MTLRTSQRGLIGLIACIVFGLPTGLAFAQQPETPQAPSDTPKTRQKPTTQPARHPDTQAAFEKLMRLKEQMEREKLEREKAATTQTGDEAAPATRAAIPATRTAPTARDREQDRQRRLEALRERARASTQRSPSREAPTTETPEDFIGPPETLAEESPLTRRTTERDRERPSVKPPTVKEEPKPLERREHTEDEPVWFNCVGMAWEDVITNFVERIGKPLLTEDLYVGGELTYVTDRKFTKEEAIDELNLIMHEKGYRFVEFEHHIRVVPLSEMPLYVDLSKVYRSVEAFREADPRDMDYVTVYYQVQDQKAQVLVDMFGDALPDYTRLSALDESNQIKLVALARDVRRFLTLKDMISITPSDPRKLKIFEIKTNARTIEQLLRDFLNLRSRTTTLPLRRDPKTGRMVRTARPATPAPSSQDVQMVADDRTNSIIVKATQDKLDEIEKLIGTFDKEPDIGEFKTHVIEIKHADATEVASLLNQILQQEQGSSRTPSWQLRRNIQRRTSRGARQPQPRTVQTQGSTPEDIMTEGIFERAKKTIRLVADPRMNALIVYANKEGLARVNEMLEDLDKPQSDNMRTFTLEHAEVGDIAPLLGELVSGMLDGGARGARGPSIVPDESKNLLYVIAERDAMERIAELITQLDVEAPEPERHVVQLANLRPSDVGQMVRGLLEGSSSGTSRAIRRGARGRRTPSRSSVVPGSSYQIIPLDEAQILIVICSEEDWKKIEDTILLWDEKALTNTPHLETFTIEKGNAQSIATMLAEFYRSYQHPAFGRGTGVSIRAEGDKVLVYGIPPALEEISGLIEVLDVERTEDKVEILPLSHADAMQVAQQLQVVLSGTTGRRGRGMPGGPMIQAEPITNSLIVQAGKKDMEKIKDFAQQMDEKVAAQVPERKFITLRYATPREVASAVQQLFSSGMGGRSRRGGIAVGTQVKAIATGPQVIIEAPADKMPEIEAFIQQLDDPKGNEIVIKTIKLPGADVTQIASKLSGAFRAKPNVVARFDPDPSAEAILLTCSKDALEQAEQLIEEYNAAAKGVTPQVEFVQMKYAQASTASQWLRDQLLTYMQQQLGRRAAAMIKVTADARTNRVVINGPEVAVTYGKTLLETYDMEVTQPVISPMRNEARKLPGLNVRNLAKSLNDAFRNDAPRPDRLRATFSFDEATQTLIISAPQDMCERIDKLIATFEQETEELITVQEFIAIKEADANYIANQLRQLLSQYVTQRRGRQAAQQINIGVDTRLNRLTLSAPKFAIELAKDLVTKLDQPPLGKSQLKTLALANADVGTVYNVLRTIFAEKIRAKTLQISPEQMTNSLIIGGSEEDFADIEKWAKELDEQAVVKGGELKIVDVLSANPWEIINILNVQYGASKRGARNRVGQEIKFSVVAGRSIVVQAPKDKMQGILDLIKQLNDVGVDKVEVRTYELQGIGGGIQDLARQVTNAINSQQQARERRVTITPYPATDTLIVTARTDQFEQIQEMMDKFKTMVEKETTVTKFIELQYLDASRYARTIQDMLANKLSREKRGSRAMQNLSITPDARTNRLICYLPEKILPDLEEVITFLDVEPKIQEGELRTIELAYAEANTVATILRPMFEQTRRARRQEDYSQIEVRIQAEPITNSLIVTASERDFEQIKNKALEIDEGAIINKSEPELIKLEYADPWQLVNVINNAFTQSGQKWGTRRNVQREVNVQVVGSQLLVQAPKEKLEEVRELITKLDVADTGGIVLKTFVLPGMGYELNNLAAQIQRILQTLEPPTRSQRGRSSVSAYPQADTLIAAVPADQLVKVEELIEQFTQGAGDLRPVTKFYGLEYARAAEIVTPLNQIVQARVGRTRGRQAQQQLSVNADARSNRIVVVAPESLQAEVAKVIESLDVPPETIEGELRSIPLVNADASTVCNTLRSLFQEKARQRRQDKSYIPVTLTPETITNSILLYGGDEADQQLLKQEIARIDDEVVANELRPVPLELRFADPTDMARLINDMFGTGRRGRGQNEQQSVQATVNNGMLVVRAPKKKLEQIRDLLDEVDAEDPGGIEIKTFELKVLNASHVQTAVQLFLKDLRQSKRAGQLSPGAFAEPTTNTLVVIAPKLQMPFIETLIMDLESKGPREGRAETYVLRNIRAEQIAQNIDTMLKAKVTEREGVKKTSVQTAVFADPTGNRLLVFAPEEYQKLAAELIKMLDEEVDTGEIVHIIALENGDATQVAQSLNQIVQSGGRGGRGGRGGGDTGRVRIVADTGSNSLLLSGLPKDVAEVEGWLGELEGQSDTLIPEMQIFQLEYATPMDVSTALSGIFGGARNPQDAVTITEDDYYSRLIVTANRRNMRKVEKFIETLDRDPTPPGSETLLEGGRQLYFVDINRGNASDIAWDAGALFPSEDRGGPSIESDWFGEYIIVKCRPAEFKRIEDTIREFERRIKVETVQRIYNLKGADTDAILQYLMARSDAEDIVIDRPPTTEKRETLIEDLWGEDEEPPAVRQKRERAARRAMRFETGLPLADVLLGEGKDDEPTAPPPVTEAAPASAPATGGMEYVPASRDPADESGSLAGTTVESPIEKPPTRIVVQPDGTILIQGPREDVDDLTDAIDLFREEQSVGEVIRIFRFRYGDVTAAAEVLNIMFDVRQRQVVIQQPQQQRGRQQREGEDQRGQQSMLEQYRGMVGGRQTGRKDTGPSLRITTDPGHNYLIVKCDASFLPEIRQLLRELDIPPGEVQVKIFQLKNLAADETAENIKDILGISKVQQRRGRSTPTPRGRGGNRQQQLMEMLQQQLVSVPGVEGGAKVERVEIVSNAVTNSLLVSAPPEVMDVVANVIDELENLEGRDVIGIHHYQLEHARVDDVLPLLESVFDATGGGGGGAAARRGGRGGTGSSPAAIGPVTISGDPRKNTLIFTAEAKDVEIVEGQIRALDIEGAVAEAEIYVCQFGDAEAIAAVLEPIYAATGGRQASRRGGSRGGATSTGSEVRIVAEAATNSILVWGPPDKRDLIFEKITKLDTLAEREIHEIDVVYADPEELAATLGEIFAGGSGTTPSRGRRGQRGQRGSSGVTTGRVMIIGDKDDKKLLVRGPDEVVAQIEELVVTLDQPSAKMKLRRFPLRYAEANTVVDSVKNAISEYMQLSKGMGDEVDFDAFTAMPDPRTNSVMIVGSEETFAFVQEILTAIDVETPEDQKKEFRIFVLDKAAATTVADAINSFATGNAGTSTGRSRGGRRGASGVAGGPRELNVFAIPEETTNSVMVFGRMEDIDLVETAVIENLEDSISDRYRIETITVENVEPSQVVSFIWQFIDQGTAAASGGTGRGGSRRGTRGGLQEDGGPQIVPNDNAGTLVVRGTKRQITEVRDLVERFDNPDFTGETIKIIEIPYGQDATRLAGEVERLINDSQTDMAERTGRRPLQVTIGADEYTNALIVAGDPTAFGLVESIVKQLSEVRPDSSVTRVIEFINLSAEDAEQIVDELQQQRRGGSSGRSSGTRRSGGSRRTPSRSSGRRSSVWPSPAPWSNDWSDRLGPSVMPCVTLTPMTPVLALYLAGAGDDEPLPERFGALRRVVLASLSDDEETQPPARPRTRLRNAQRDALEELDEQPPEPEEPPQEPETQVAESQPVMDTLSGVSGALRGEVTARAVDSQRIIITGDASDVDFIEQILFMMEKSASPAVIDVFTLQNAKATALAPIIEAAIQAKIDARTKSPGPQDKFSINAEGRSNSLIVSASEKIMNEIDELVARLDVEDAGGGTTFRTIPLANMRAVEAVAVLQPTVEKLNKMREVPTESQASISAIERNNSVMIVGTPTDVEEIERLVKTIDVELTKEDEQASFVRADVILIPLKNGRAEDIAKVLTDMIEEQQENARKADPEKPGEPFVKVLRLRLADGRELPELNLDRPIKLIPEAGTNSLIIFSSENNNEALQEIVGVFDSLPIGADTDVKAFALQHAAAEDVAKLLQDIFDKKRYLQRPSQGDSDSFEKGVMPPVPPGVAAKGLPYPLLVQHDVRSNTVIIIGRNDAVILAGGLITELDRPTMDLGVEAYVLDLKYMQATQLAEKLEELLADRAKALGGDKNEARDSAVIQPEERSNSLIVFATAEVYDMIEDLVLQLDAAKKYSVVDLHYRPLKWADAVKLQGLLDEMFKAKQDAESKTNKESNDTLTVMADTRSNALLLTGTRDYLSEAEALIEQLDRQYDGTVVFKIHKVKLNSAVNIAMLLKEMIDEALKEQDSKLSGTPIHVAADPLSESLLLAAAQEDLVMIESWVEILDRPSEIGRMTRIIPLGRADAEEVAKAVDDVFKQRAGQNMEIDLTVSFDPQTNAVVAFGPPGLLGEIEDFARQLDMTEATSGVLVQIFKLEQADVEEAGELLRRILELEGGDVGGGGGGGGGGEEIENRVMLIWQELRPDTGLETLKALRSDIVIISDIRTNSLIVEAPPESMSLMESLVVAIDTPPDAATIRVFPLRNADAEQMVEMLETLFENRTSGGASDESNRVLSLSDGMLGGGRQEIGFTTDVRTNAVIAAGTKSYLDLAEQMILELDTIPINDRRTFVYAPRNITAETLAASLRDYSQSEQDLLQEIGDEISLARRQEREIVAIANEDANRVILGVSPRFEDAVLSVVHELDQPPPQVMIQVLIIEVTMDNSLELGVEFAFQDLQYAKAGPSDTTTFDYVGGTDIGAAGSGLGGFTFTITGADFNFLFRTLLNDGNLRVLSRPQIVAMDNQEALINISDSVPYITGTQTSSTGQISTSVNRQDVGIKLQVTPQINPDGFVRLTIEQEVSDQTGSTVDVGQGLTAPIFFTRQTDTTITVKDNETVVLGGLIQSRAENREQKIPILGDIPGLGLLFRNQNDDVQRKELLIVLTPHVLRTPEDYRRMSEVERDRMKLIGDELCDPLMQGLRVHADEPQALEDEPLEPVRIPSEIPVREDEPAGELYGPIGPAIQPDRPEQADPDSYDVPLTCRT